MTSTVPDLTTLRKEAEEVLISRLSRIAELVPGQWVGREGGTTFDPSYHLTSKVRITQGAGRGKEWWLQALIKKEVYPKQARLTIWELKKGLLSVGGTPVYPLLIAPHITEGVAELCREEGVGYLDLAGNCHLFFGGIWIDIKGNAQAYRVNQAIKSVFSPKASRLLRLLLQGPLRAWKVEEMAAQAGVSIGLVSRVRKVLLKEEWAEEAEGGIVVTQPAKVLSKWLAADDFFKRTQVQEYSTLSSGDELAARLAENFSDSGTKPLFTLNYAAWLRAPHNVPSVVSAYVEEFPSDEELAAKLGARPVQRGAGNLRLLKHSDHHALTIDQREDPKRPDITLVSDLQLYLDLNQAEPNGTEQAGVLRAKEDFAGGWS
ncbi:hypothetical protein JIN77_08570 [Verrucomicrobiaceae bacterium R5-34]|nr:hypothetical protein [Verrucomicrobiaceae bacterium R5-34]